MNDDACETYNTNSQIKLKNSMLNSCLCNYSDAYILVKGTIANAGAELDPAARQVDKRTKQVINSALFTDCISEITNRTNN